MGTSVHAAPPALINRSTDAVVTVDMQTAFMPEHVTDGVDGRRYVMAAGGLPVKDGHLIVPVVQQVEAFFDHRYATRDEHPYGHISLASSYVGLDPWTVLTEEMVAGWTNGSRYIGPSANFVLADLESYLAKVKAQVLWPDHALEGTVQSDLHPALSPQNYFHVQAKGRDPRVDSYSGFHDNIGRETGLGALMKMRGVENVFVQGLAEDFCVGWTAIGAKKLGFKNVYLVEDATKPVDLPGTRQRMRDDLAAAGVIIVRSEQLRAA